MKWTLLFLTIFSTSLWAAKPVVLVSYYDAFGKAPFNNSERVALALAERMKDSPVQIKLCALKTVFDKAYAQTEDCLKELKEQPALVLGLGESNCNMKVEFAMRNVDKTKGPDNEGNNRKGEIIPNAPDFNSLRYPLPQMYCALTSKDRNELEFSNNAGSFVCNNTAYQMNHYHPELQFGFIHVPSNNCKGLEKKNEFVLNALSTMIIKGVEFLSTQFVMSLDTPHSSNEIRMPLLKDEIQNLRSTYQKSDKCMYEFFKKVRGVDERGFWSILN